jgi:hypothetical protein
MVSDPVKPKLSEIRAMVRVASPGPWLWRVTPDRKWSVVLDPDGDEVARLADDEDSAFVAQSRTDIPALLAALDAVLAVHYEAYNDTDLSPLCQTCKGAPGVHPCGCWGDEQAETVCGSCRQGTKGQTVTYPCPTVWSISEHIDLEVPRGG